MTNIFKTLKNDHDKHRELLETIGDTSGDSQTRRDAWSEFFTDVSAHAAAEEEAFYAPLMETKSGQPEARHSVAEHKELDDLMQELNETDMSSPAWLATFKKLRHDYEHHMEEEENEIFAQAKKSIGDKVDGSIAEKFKKRKAKERDLVTEKAENALVD
ncbi:hemerythrin domain-containing protein [Fretibacter rubidus]|uniref:hemerythrin domain-containing protein n=1 Tax=Fretibacter rubidus TaxID=570162 RepID=UPI00352A64FB